MKPYPIELRQRIVNAVKAGESRKNVAKHFDVGYVTVRNYLKLDALGSLEPRKKKRAAIYKKFTPAALDAMKVWLEEKNDLTLKQIQQRLAADFQIQVSRPVIWERLAAMNLSWKKNRLMPPNGNAPTSRRNGRIGRRKSATRR